ncbi:hypothetical protein R5H55_000334 [Enterococcus faecium]|uniref:hypothetical protein n=1 Tax=Enterococcus TaxID=1350 RepID=UPI0005EAF19D|nr:MULTISPECIES: hypothetical protein [Enterococcus]EGP5619860.1 hypothetical protein [Enterococcus faecium]EGP5717798.1 hypothetical protein [Enterococcus faecium]EME3522424.1 hypothetical protein [Enterococcus faecium]EME8259582.1 hypothetical protein [Enterococcus faecium]EMF0364822.1 hypothetical protein [Enterococcus faecium]
MRKVFSILFWVAPWVTGAVFLGLLWFLKLDVKVHGLDNLLNSMIAFTSMIIGFYSAFFGILIAIKETGAMKRIRGTKVEKNLKYLLYMAIFTAFITLMLSMVLQIVKHYPSPMSKFIFNMWFFMIGVFIIFSFQTVVLSLELIFNNNPIKKKNLN